MQHHTKSHDGMSFTQGSETIQRGPPQSSDELGCHAPPHWKGPTHPHPPFQQGGHWRLLAPPLGFRLTLC